MALTSTTPFTAINAQVTMKKIFVVAVLFCLLGKWHFIFPKTRFEIKAKPFMFDIRHGTETGFRTQDIYI